MPLRYASGEIIAKGDRIRYGGELGEVEFVADPDAPNEETDWYVQEYGSGCMILTKAWGRILLHKTEEDVDLEFLSRQTSAGSTL